MNQPSKKHSGIRTFLSISASRLTRSFLHLMKRGGTTLPGRAAMSFDPAILEVVSRNMEIIVVTGTNGKTTTCSMLRHALTAAHIDVLSNISGANLLTGITAEFTANATLGGKPKKHYAIIECDEGALRKVVPLIHPRCLVVTNLFRDQLDRYGEVMHTREMIQQGIAEIPKTTLVLNADDSLTASLGEHVPNPVLYYGVSVPDQKSSSGDAAHSVSDAKYCIHCGTEYQYAYHTYAHLGAFFCPKCGYKRPDPQVEVTGIKRMNMRGSRIEITFHESGTEKAKRKIVDIGLPALYNIYNAAAAISAFRAAGFNENYILRSLIHETSSFGRMENFHYQNTDIQMILVKNPAGCNQALSYLTSVGEDYTGVFCLNDKTADGHDISWIWDADFEKVAADPHARHLFVWGTRAADLQLRLKYAGIPENQVTLVENLPDLLEKVTDPGLPVFILPNYTSMLSLRKVLGEVTGKKEFWKEQSEQSEQSEEVN